VERRAVTDAGPISVHRVPLHDIGAMREAYRAEMDCQIVHDAIHHRAGWSLEHVLVEGDRAVGYASLAVGGPWRDRPTFYEIYVAPDRRSRTYALFDAFVAATRPPAFEVQSNDVLTTTMALTFARDVASEKVVFRDVATTSHRLPGATLRCVTPAEDIRAAIAARQGGGEWLLEVDGVVVGKGGILFHYNAPYGDVYMEVDEGCRRRGRGSYLVQELKRLCYELGGIPAARCDPANAASRRTLQNAGLLPYAHMLVGSFAWPTTSGGT
jgi:GNAT superfamily N-acetyltransferase